MAPDPTVTAEALVLVQAQAAAREEVSAATQAAVAAALRAFLASAPRAGAGFYDRAAVTRLSKTLAAATRAGQRQTATSTAAYWARAVALLTGRRPSGARLVDTATLRPVALDAVFGRLADQYRWLESSRGADLSPDDRLRAAVEATTRRVARLAASADRPDLGVVDGEVVARRIGSPDEDVSAAELARRIDALLADHPLPSVDPGPLSDDDLAGRVLRRAEVLVDQSLTLAMRAQVRASSVGLPSTVTGYRRVLHPELAKSGESCGLCVAASTRLYHRDVLLPVHGHCHCTVLPVLGEPGGDGDVGGVINDYDLAKIYDAAGSTGGRDLKRTRWRVVEHPELGPTLVPADGRIVPLTRTPADSGGRRRATPGTLRPQVDPTVVAQVARRTIEDLERRAADGEDTSKALAWQRDLLARMLADAA